MSDLVISGNFSSLKNFTFTGTNFNIIGNIKLLGKESNVVLSTTNPYSIKVVHGGLYVGRGASYFQGNLYIGEIKNSNTVTVVGNTFANDINVSGNLNNNYPFVSSLTNPTFFNILDVSGVKCRYIQNNSDNNVWFGNNTLHNNSLSSVLNNTALGNQALNHLVDGSNNVTLGYHAMNNDISGSNNVAIGADAIKRAIKTYGCTAVGTQSIYSLSSPDASYNTAVGFQSMKQALSSFQNTCIGALTCGHRDTRMYGGMTAFGYQAGFNDFQGNNNTFVGAFTDSVPYDVGNGFHQSTAIGYNAKISSSNQIVLGTVDETVYIPGNLIIDGTLTVAGNVIPSLSDVRLKEDMVAYPSVLFKVLQLEPVQFRWKDSKREDMGFVAQQFYEVMTPEVWPEDIRYTRPDGMMTLDYGKIVMVLTMAVKELQDKIMQKKRIKKA